MANACDETNLPKQIQFWLQTTLKADDDRQHKAPTSACSVQRSNTSNSRGMPMQEQIADPS
jgi:hypothetical protein